MIKTGVVDVLRSLILAVIVLQKNTREIEAVDDPSINTNPKNLKNIHATIQVTILIRQMTVPIQLIAIIHEVIFYLYNECLCCILNSVYVMFLYVFVSTLSFRSIQINVFYCSILTKAYL